ncbi:CC0125/CC1285 family lipoprotein [Terricaulis sp.]|uniref:CC0125/CC1285 family lipoprotein n=1 Tax=Terricaulis sp. TaxID=2768686 RepID=UPI0037849540
MRPRSNFHSFAVFAVVAFLGACASTPTYTPAARQGGAGYSEQRIESNRYTVTYRASGSANAQLLEDYALLRAADLAIANGSEWFWVDRRTLDDGNSSYGGPSVGIGVGGGSWGGRSGGSVGVGINIPIGNGGAQQARSATLDIRFGEGPKPDDANAYDARETAANLRSRLPG